MSTISTDILVIGAGPGGATAARFLAAGGRDVFVLEAKKMPRVKPCAGGLPGRTLRALDLDVSSLVQTSVTSVALDGAWSGRQLYSLDQAGKEDVCLAGVVDRAAFDHFLTQKAEAAGARVLDSCRCRKIERTRDGFIAQTADLTVQAKTICACDGVRSPAALALGFPKNRKGFCLEALVPMRADLDAAARQRAIFHSACIRTGYAWAFPRGDFFTIGIGSTLPRNPRLRQMLIQFQENTPELRGSDLQQFQGGFLPFFTAPRPCYAEKGAYLVGDAAGLVDPLTGEGIYFAIESGRFAAESILTGDEQAYDRRIRETLVADLLASRKRVRRFHAIPVWLRGMVLGTRYARRQAEYLVHALS